jgi:two-component system, OmpR family, sensor kinase
MTIPGGIRVKLSLALLFIVGSALLAAYAIIVPSLERRLVAAKLDQQQSDAEILAIRFATEAAQNTLSLGDFVDGADFISNSRVVVFGVGGTPEHRTLLSLGDSSAVGGSEMESDPTALAAATNGSTMRARVRHDGREFAEVAVPLFPGGDVMLLSSSLADQLATVALVKRRLLDATLAALLISLVLGFAVATLHARRLGRLQRAADLIAEGAFDEPVVDHDLDEVGQLAASFDRMRLQLAQLDSARKEFVANASHELRTPLFSIAGFLELLDDEDLDETTRMEFLATTRSQVDRLTNLATDLLDLSRMDAGRIRIEHEEVGLAEIARQVAEDFFALADASNHTLLLDVDDDAWAHADEERIQQIARALTGNALVHTPAGTIVLLRVEQRGDRVALAVEDSGPGIPAEHLERVFQRFYRVDGGRASGSGLGLAIARELAGRMDGTVTVTTRPGSTVFTLDLPAEGPVLRSPAPLSA